MMNYEIIIVYLFIYFLHRCIIYESVLYYLIYMYEHTYNNHKVTVILAMNLSPSSIPFE